MSMLISVGDAYTFGDLLLELDFGMLKGEMSGLKCDHSDQSQWKLYHQDSPDGSYLSANEKHNLVSKDLTWYWQEGCKHCIAPLVGMLLCGGIYSNIRLFEIVDEKEVDRTSSR